MDLQLENKRSLVTGSTAGIGFAIAEALASEGASVIINGRSQQSVDEAIGKLSQKATGKLTGFAGDLSREDVAEKLGREHPDIDILVNSLGIFEPVPFEQITDDDWRRFFDVNVMSGVRLSRLYLPGMKQRNWGRIIFTPAPPACRTPRSPPAPRESARPAIPAPSPRLRPRRARAVPRTDRPAHAAPRPGTR